MKVAVGGIVHDRWTVPEYLRAMGNLDMTGIEPLWVWVVDAEEDNFDWAEGDLIVRAPLPGPHYHRQGGDPALRHATYVRLACLRNILAEVTMAMGCDGLFSVDSDIIPPPDTLVRLVAAEKPWMAALVRNCASEPWRWNVFRYSRPEQKGGLVRPFQAVGVGTDGQSWPGPEGSGCNPHDAKRTEDLAAGAVCFYGRELLRRARWESHPSGGQEDLGFAAQAFAAGFRAWYLPIVCRHLTIDGLEA